MVDGDFFCENKKPPTVYQQNPLFGGQQNPCFGGLTGWCFE